MGATKLIRMNNPAYSYRVGTCEGCNNFHVRVTRHHLIPRATETPEERISRSSTNGGRMASRLTVWLCKPCHTLIHQKFTNEELRKMSREQQLSVLEFQQPYR